MTAQNTAFLTTEELAGNISALDNHIHVEKNPQGGASFIVSIPR